LVAKFTAEVLAQAPPGDDPELTDCHDVSRGTLDCPPVTLAGTEVMSIEIVPDDPDRNWK
jgi:hypothetical protein